MSCPTCWGEGVIVTCIDDMCHGTDECIHGDGYSLCPTCDGTGDLPRFDDDYPDDPALEQPDDSLSANEPEISKRP